MTMTNRVGVLGLLVIGGAWSCGGTVAHSDSETSESNAGGSDGIGGGFGDGSGGSAGSMGDASGGNRGDGSGGTSVGGSGADSGDSTGSGPSTVGAGGAPTTRGADAGPATTRGDTTSNTTSGSSDDSAALTSTSSGIAVTGAGGVGSTDVGSAVNTTVGTTGNGGFGGDPTNNTASFGSTSVVTTTTGSGGTEPEPPTLDEYPYLDDCASSYWNVNSNYCSLNFTCSDEPGQYGWISCGESGDGGAACSCNNYDFWPSYLVHDADFDSACAYATSACVAGTKAETGKPVCTPAYLYQSTNYCSATANCETPIEIEGALMTKTGTSTAYCEEREDLWVCTCSTSDGRANFRLDVSEGSSSMCVDALDWCEGEITAEGPRTCEPNTLNAQTNWCSVSLVCTQDALVGGVPATLNESYSASCERGESDSWVCDCPGAGSLEVEAETAWDACTLAAPDCTPE